MPTKQFSPTASRSDYYSVSPSDLTINEALRGRHIPPTLDEIKAMAVSIHSRGQLQPVQVRKIANEVILVLGFTRVDAIKLLREGFEHEGVKYHEPDFKVKVLNVTTNNEDAFINNVIENAHRKDTSPIDNAYNQLRFERDYQKSDEEIAKIYRCSVQKIVQTRQLLALSKEQQMMVHNGTLPVSAALDLLELPEEKREEIIVAATADSVKGTVKVKGTKVRQAVRNVLNDNAKDKPNQPTKNKNRSNKEIADFFQAESVVDGPSGELAKALLGFVKGTVNDADMKKAWDAAMTVGV